MTTYRGSPGVAGAGMGGRIALARIVNLATTIAVGIVVAGIVLRVASANLHNDVVRVINDAARWLVGPFHDLFAVHGDWHFIVNWGIAAALYLVVGRFIARGIA
jgi:hypothetical protein